LISAAQMSHEFSLFLTTNIPKAEVKVLRERSKIVQFPHPYVNRASFQCKLQEKARAIDCNISGAEYDDYLWDITIEGTGLISFTAKIEDACSLSSTSPVVEYNRTRTFEYIENGGDLTVKCSEFCSRKQDFIQIRLTTVADDTFEMRYIVLDENGVIWS
jgi:hypothetical protein